jgi:hypothetical protein
MGPEFWKYKVAAESHKPASRATPFPANAFKLINTAVDRLMAIPRPATADSRPELRTVVHTLDQLLSEIEQNDSAAFPHDWEDTIHDARASVNASAIDARLVEAAEMALCSALAEFQQLWGPA